MRHESREYHAYEEQKEVYHAYEEQKEVSF
jgi:hypothetical protein